MTNARKIAQFPKTLTQTKESNKEKHGMVIFKAMNRSSQACGARLVFSVRPALILARSEHARVGSAQIGEVMIVAAAGPNL